MGRRLQSRCNSLSRDGRDRDCHPDHPLFSMQEFVSPCTTRKPTPPPARRRRCASHHRSRAASRPSTTCRSRSSSAASATPTCTTPATSGTTSCRRSTRACRATRSSAASTKVGSAVTKFKAGDLVGVGCLVDSDRTCPNCKDGLEQFCPNMTLTYNSPDKHETAPVTYGGYSDSIVVDERFVLRIPANLDLAGAAPLLCAGITTYSPLRHWNVGQGQEGRRRRPRRAGPHGREVRPRVRRARRRLHHLAEQEGGRASGSARTRSSSRRTPTR